jgi:RNA polymerase sigma-70 factor (ECF subfamily)
VGDDSGKIPQRYAAELSRFFEANDSWLFGHARFQASRDRDLAAGRELAADLVQDTFEAAANKWETLREFTEARQRAWLRTTLSHKATDSFRRRVAFRRRQRELQYRYQGVEPDTERHALSAIALERAAEIIQGLPDRQKRIALMKWDDHMKESEIAAELGCKEAAVTSQVALIRRKLIDGLGPYYPFGGDEGKEGHRDEKGR